MDKKGKIALVTALVLVGILLVAVATAAPRAKKACMDGVDNDGDGYIDLNDPGCSRVNDNSELNPNVECDDGIDNDGDCAIDYNDNGCSGPTDNDETDCGDGVCEGGEVCEVCVADCGPCDSCSDTDGGWNELTQGTVSGYLNDEQYEDTDYCVDDITLKEYYCSGNHAYNSNVNCGGNTTGSCVNGACV